MRPRLAQLHQSGATDGQVATWDAALGYWVPADPGTGGGETPSVGEQLVVDGVSPPEPLTTEDETDFLYLG